MVPRPSYRLVIVHSISNLSLINGGSFFRTAFGGFLRWESGHSPLSTEALVPWAAAEIMSGHTKARAEYTYVPALKELQIAQIQIRSLINLLSMVSLWTEQRFKHAARAAGDRILQLSKIYSSLGASSFIHMTQTKLCLPRHLQ